MIPYVPTVLASTLVLFLGIELTVEAVWESTKTHQSTEWLVIMATLVACTFLGYAIGFGVGVGAATLVYLFWGIRDTVSHLPAPFTVDELLTGVLESSIGRSRSGKRLFNVPSQLPTIIRSPKPTSDYGP